MDPYKILGIDANASPEQIRRAYLKQAAKYHPDQGGEAWIFQQVQAAYEKLKAKNPELADSEKRGPAGNPPPPGSQKSRSTQSTPRDESRRRATAGTSPRTSPNRKRKRARPGVELLKVVGGGVAGLLVAVLILWYGFRVDPLGLWDSDEIADAQVANATEEDSAKLRVDPSTRPPIDKKTDRTRPRLQQPTTEPDSKANNERETGESRTTAVSGDPKPEPKFVAPSEVESTVAPAAKPKQAFEEERAATADPDANDGQSATGKETSPSKAQESESVRRTKLTREIVVTSDVDGVEILIHADGELFREATLTIGENRFSVPEGDVHIALSDSESGLKIISDENGTASCVATT